MNVESGIAQSQHFKGETSEQARAAEQLGGGGLTANAALLSNLARLDSKQKTRRWQGPATRGEPRMILGVLAELGVSALA